MTAIAAPYAAQPDSAYNGPVYDPCCFPGPAQKSEKETPSSTG